MDDAQDAAVLASGFQWLVALSIGLLTAMKSLETA
jgi:hypothetical protein